MPLTADQANGLDHGSRGERPRFVFKNNFCPVRAIQVGPPSVAYATIVARLERSHHFFDQRAPPVADAERSRTDLGISVAHPSKSGMQLHYYWRRRGSRPRPVQSHKKFPTAKVLEILKKDSSKFVKTLDSRLRDFHWQDGYGLFSVSPSHLEPVRKYILNQEEHHKEETFQEEYLQILKKYRAPYDERYLWD
jgi:hypothetical protein